MKYIKLFENYKENINSNFWNWFGNSQLKSKDGTPTIVYHGTKTKGLTEFSRTSDIGFHFALSPKIAFDMAGSYDKYEDEGYGFSHIEKIPPIACYLSIQNMGVLPDMEFWRKSDLLKAVDKENNYRKTDNIPLLNFEYDSSLSLIDNMKIFSMEINPLECDWKDIDGFIYYNEYEGRFTNVPKWSYIALKPNQIKSVDNDGSWDINDNNIFS